jgi:hypothetical protein
MLRSCGVQEGRGALGFGRKSRLRLPDDFRVRVSPKSDESDTSLGESLRFNIKRLAGRQNRPTGWGVSGGRVGAQQPETYDAAAAARAPFTHAARSGNLPRRGACGALPMMHGPWQ